MKQHLCNEQLRLYDDTNAFFTIVQPFEDSPFELRWEDIEDEVNRHAINYCPFCGLKLK